MEVKDHKRMKLLKKLDNCLYRWISLNSDDEISAVNYEWRYTIIFSVKDIIWAPIKCLTYIMVRRIDWYTSGINN